MSAVGAGRVVWLSVLGPESTHAFILASTAPSMYTQQQISELLTDGSAGRLAVAIESKSPSRGRPNPSPTIATPMVTPRSESA